jgi:hypothetical protein
MMYECIYFVKKNECKEWQTATKPFKKVKDPTASANVM